MLATSLGCGLKIHEVFYEADFGRNFIGHKFERSLETVAEVTLKINMGMY